ncbi:YicC/YloC family endoribonuclease [Deferrisoma sp.]
MIRSMTGYGRAEAEVLGRWLTVEIKTVNHRFLNFNARLPGDLQRFEHRILARVKETLQRGQVNLFAGWDAGGPDTPAVTVNREAAKRAAELLREVAREAGIEAEVRLEHLLAFPAVTEPATLAADAEALWEAVCAVLDRALQDLEAFRRREGEDLARDMAERVSAIEARVGEIDALRGRVVESYRERLRRRVEELAREVPEADLEARLAMEVAILADRCDVSEELVRLRSHIDGFRKLLDAGGVVGRKLEFVLQEMNRETNTIGSKASDAEVGRLVVEIKSELEKIREQVQNVE